MTTHDSTASWTIAYTEQALREGWMLFNDDEIQRDDEAGLFVSDEDALNHVARCAGAGSELHQLALSIHNTGLASRAAAVS
jgi:hypothetical protein